MNIPSSISSINTRPTIPAADAAKVSGSAPLRNAAEPATLNVTRGDTFGVELMTDDIDLSKESFGKLGELFDKAFNFPAPPMPNFAEAN